MFASTAHLVRSLGIGLLLVFLVATPVLATPATPSAVDDQDLGAFIREGTCASPGTVIEDVGDLDEDKAIWEVIGNGMNAPDIVFGEDEGIEQSIEQILNSHAIITIHATDDKDAAILACGSIEGTVESDGTLMIDLKPVGDSGISGRVHFGPLESGDEQTEVTIGVWRTAPATPEATPKA